MTKRVDIQSRELLPHKPTFTFAVSKAQSQGCYAKFSYSVAVTGPREFCLTVTRKDQEQGWEHDLHIRWEAGGGAPNISQEDGASFDEEVARMVAMGFEPEAARRALQFKEGDLGAAASFIGACECADSMPAEDPARRAEAVAIQAALVVPKGGPVELTKLNQGSEEAQLVEEPTGLRLPQATPLSTTESILEPQPLAGWSN